MAITQTNKRPFYLRVSGKQSPGAPLSKKLGRATAWKFYQQGFRDGVEARKSQETVVRLYHDECKIFGGPCIGRDTCRARLEQQQAVTGTDAVRLDP